MEPKRSPIKQGCLSFIVAAIVVSGLAFGLNTLFKGCGRYQNSNEPSALKITCQEFKEKYQKDTSFLKPYWGKYIELEGVLLGMPSYDGGEIEARFAPGNQQDSAYFIAQPLLWRKVKANGQFSPCDSLLVSVGSLYNITESSPYYTFIADLQNADTDTIFNYKYYPACDSTHIHARKNYLLENFCAETIVVKARLDRIVTDNDGYRIFLENGVVLARSKLKKKINMR